MICSIMLNVRDELDILEWLCYHIYILKFDLIFLYDNESIIPVKEYIKDHPISSHVNIIYIPGKGIKQKARRHYLKYYIKKSDWTAFLDADEYIVLKSCNNIKDFISKFNYSDLITFNWNIIGSNNILKRNGKLVIDNYTKSENTLNHHVKSLVRNSKIININSADDAHLIKTIPGSICIDTLGNKKDQTPYHENNKQIDCIFHYMYKSKEDWISKCNLCNKLGVLDNGTPGWVGRHIDRWDFSLICTKK